MLRRFSAIDYVAIAVVFWVAPIASANDCEFLTKGGIYDYESTSFDSEQVNSFVDWFRSHDEATYQDAKSQGFGLSVPIDDVLIGAKYEANESGFKQFKHDIETYRSGNNSNRYKVTTSLKKINPFVIKAVSDCINQDGLHVWLETTGDPKVFKLAARFVSDGSPFEKIYQIDPVGATCRPGMINTELKPGNTKRIHCDRKNPTVAVDVIVNASRNPKGGGDLSLAGIPATPPTEPVLGTWDGQAIYIGPTIVVKGETFTQGAVTAFVLYIKPGSKSGTLVSSVADPGPNPKWEQNGNTKFDTKTGDLSYVQGPSCDNLVSLELDLDGNLKGSSVPAVQDPLGCTITNYKTTKNRLFAKQANYSVTLKRR